MLAMLAFSANVTLFRFDNSQISCGNKWFVVDVVASKEATEPRRIPHRPNPLRRGAPHAPRSVSQPQRGVVAAQRILAR